MKTINKLLIIFTILLAYIHILIYSILNFDGDGNQIVIILKDASITLTITLPYIFEKVFKIKIDESFKLCWIIFIFMAHYVGVILEVFFITEGFDKVTHTLSGVISAYVALLILNHNKIKNKVINILFIIAFSTLCAVCWEIFEYVCNILFGGDAQMVEKTGVNDTMIDMIVALIGALCFSVWYKIKKTSWRLFYYENNKLLYF